MNLHEAGLIRRYLLGQLLPDDQAEIEQRLLTDSDFLQEIVIGEEELIDEYVSHQLTNSEVQAFESHFLATEERKQQLRFGRCFAKYLDESTETAVDEAFNETAAIASSDSAVDSAKADRGTKRRSFSFFPALNPALSYGLAAVILLAVVGIALRNRIAPSDTQGSLLAVTLAPGLTREGGETKRVKLLNDTGRVEIRVIIPTADYKVYRTRLLTDGRSELWASEDLTPVEESGTRVVTSTIPAGLLAPGDYRMTLSGRANNGAFEDVATYPFRVTR